MNGTIQLPDEATGRITGYEIIFSDGILRNMTSWCDLYTTTTYDLANTNSIILANADILLPTNSGVLSKAITVLSGATATITGVPSFSNPITLTDSTSVLNLRIASPLNQNIVLNGGTVLMTGNLHVSTGTQITGTGTINLSNNKLHIPSTSPFTGTVTFLNANDINLMGDSTLIAQMVFQGTNSYSTFNGHSYSLTFNSGSSMKVLAQQTLYVVDTHIKNFGPTGGSYGFFDIDPTSTVVIQNSTVELRGNYSHPNGTIIFKGEGSRLLTRGFSLTSTATSSFIVVDGVSLEYDYLDQPNPYPFVWSIGQASQLSLINNGTIRPTSTLSTQNLSGTSNTLYRDYYLSAVSNLNFLNATPATPVAMAFSGSGYNIFDVSTGTGSMINIAPNMTVTTSNVNLFNFNKNIVSFQASTSGLVFGTGTNIMLNTDTTITPTDFVWTFTQGASQIIGNGSTVYLTGSKRITASGGAMVTLKNLSLSLTYSDSIACLDNSSTIAFENANIQLGVNGFYFSTGNLVFTGNCAMQGGDPTSPTNLVQFTFASAGTATISSQSILRINRYLELTYMANPVNDGGSLYNSKHHFVLTDLSSTLILEGCALHSTTTGMAINQGRIVIEDKVSFFIDGTGVTAMQFVTENVNLEIKAGSELDIYGELDLN